MATDPVIIFPIICSVLSLMCAGVIFRDALSRPRPDKIAWSTAFLMFAIAAGADAAGIAFGWEGWLARTYYATGPALVVAFLAIGQLYLLFPQAMRRFGVGITLLITALWGSLVFNAPIDASRLADDGWEAIERGPEMVAVTVLINAIGTCIIVGGTAWSVWRFWRSGTHRNRMIGCALICGGTLAAAAGGSLTRFGHYEYLYIAMSLGVAMIFAGVLVSRRPESSANSASDKLEDQQTNATLVTSNLAQPPMSNANGVAFVQDMLLFRDEQAIEAICTEWSVPCDPAPVMTRPDARRAWKLRTVLSGEALPFFDDLSVGTRRQLATLYHDVLVWERLPREEIAEIVATSDPATSIRQA